MKARYIHHSFVHPATFGSPGDIFDEPGEQLIPAPYPPSANVDPRAAGKARSLKATVERPDLNPRAESK